jgi:hypothetical protein
LEKRIDFSVHAIQQMSARGASQTEVEAAIRSGGAEPARKNRRLFRKNFDFGRDWRGKRYAIKQVAPLVADEPDRVVVVAVFVFYF